MMEFLQLIGAFFLCLALHYILLCSGLLPAALVIKDGRVLVKLFGIVNKNVGQVRDIQKVELTGCWEVIRGIGMIEFFRRSIFFSQFATKEALHVTFGSGRHLIMLHKKNTSYYEEIKTEMQKHNLGRE